MMLNFKEFLNSSGRAGQHFWKPESPTINPLATPSNDKNVKHHIKGVHLNAGFRPMHPVPFKGVTADKLGIVIKKIPKLKK